MNSILLKAQINGLVLALLVGFCGAYHAAAQSFIAPQTLGVGTQPYCVAVADVNGDGKLDLISANQFDGTLTVLTNTGKGAFVASSTNAVGSQPTFVVAADVNGDGKPDLISANFGGNNLTVLTNNGDGTFTFSATLNVGTGPFNIVMVNVNGGPAVDLVCANAGANTLTVLTNDGQGNFTVSDTLTVGTSPNSSPSVAAADVNGDGRLDLISANYNDGTLTVLTNNGQGSFTFSQTLVVGNDNSLSGPSAAAADVNGDGKPDLICANYGDNNVIVLTNNGNGSFTASSTNLVGQNPFWVAAADVNRDGKTDIITANYSDKDVSVLTNNGDGTFTLSLTNTTGINPVFVTAADLNGDGALDLVSANFSDNTLTVLLDLPSLTIKYTNTAANLSWPAFWPGYVLQQNSDLTPGNWFNVSNPTETNQVIVSPATGNQFFRLCHP